MTKTWVSWMEINWESQKGMALVYDFKLKNELLPLSLNNNLVNKIINNLITCLKVGIRQLDYILGFASNNTSIATFFVLVTFLAAY